MPTEVLGSVRDETPAMSCDQATFVALEDHVQGIGRSAVEAGGHGIVEAAQRRTYEPGPMAKSVVSSGRTRRQTRWVTRAPRQGPLALVGGEEFLPGNEPQDKELIRSARMLGNDRPAFIIASAAARQGPDRAVAAAKAWFATLGLAVEELPARTRGRAMSAEIASMAARGSFFYLCGGDPGLVVKTLSDTPVWEAIVAAWRGGAALGGSSAGAMAFGSWTLIRARMPGDPQREPRPALDLVPSVAVLPHYSSFGRRWRDSALAGLTGRRATLMGIDERTAVVRHDGAWRVFGPGSATMIDADGKERVFGSGERVSDLPAPRR